MDLSTGFVGIHEFLLQLSNRKHAGFIRLVAVVACPKVYQDGFMGSHDSEACSNWKGRRKSQSTHGRIRLADDSPGGPAQNMPGVSFIVEGPHPEKPFVAVPLGNGF